MQPIKPAVTICSGAITLILLTWTITTYAHANNFETLSRTQRPEVTALEQGKPVERGLDGGGTHSYLISLAAGQFCHAVVHQLGIDVVVALYGPDGKQLVEMDSPNGTYGPERVSLVAGTSGSYKLEVRSLEKKAIAGRYRVKIEELRVATPQDNNRITAQEAYAQGVQLLVQDTAKSLQESVAKLKEALPLWRAVGDRGGEADTLNCLGRVFYETGETNKSLDTYIQALALYKALDDRAGGSNALNTIGLLYERLGDMRKALDYLSQSLDLSRAIGDRAGEATTMQNIGLLYNRLGESQIALDYYERSIIISREVGNRRDEANTLLNIGALYKTLGESQKALDYYNQSLPLHRAVGNRREEATTLGNIGAVYQDSGDNQSALDYYNRALALARDTGNRYYVATLLNNLGAVYQNLGENQKSLDHFTQALAIHQSTVNRIGESLALNNIGMHYMFTGEYQRAIEYYDQALRLRRDIGDRSGEAFTLFNMARTERRRGNLVDARSRVEAALAALESLRANVMSQQLRASFFASVRRYHELYINVLIDLHKQRPSEGFDAIALEASEKSRARSLLELLTEARAEIRQGVDPALLDQERALRQMISDKAERQMRLLSGKHTKEQAEAAAKDMDGLTTDYEQAQAQIRQKSPRYASLMQPVPLTSKEIQSDTLDNETLLLEYSLGEEKSFLWAVTPTSISIFELPKRAEIEQAARPVYEILTARNRVVPNETPEQRLKRLGQADAEYPKTSAALSRILLGPVAAELKNKRLLVVCEGLLQYIPFATLQNPTATGSRPLILDHEIVNLPSASALSVLRREIAGRKATDKTIAVFADPVFDSSDPRTGALSKNHSTAVEKTAASVSDVKRSATESGLQNFARLRFSRQEADQIERFAAEGKKLKALDFAASRAAVMNSDLRRYAILHFATHGLINNQHPDLSGIVLSLVDERGRPQNGFLRLYDIYNLKLEADLVVLSACQTALGKEVKGEGLLGLTRGFMYAGAPRVVTSLWQIDDRATAEFMRRFYEEMLGKGLRPAAALRSAQVSMQTDKRWGSPYYWGAFRLQGEWR